MRNCSGRNITLLFNSKLILYIYMSMVILCYLLGVNTFNKYRKANCVIKNIVCLSFCESSVIMVIAHSRHETTMMLFFDQKYASENQRFVLYD